MPENVYKNLFPILIKDQNEHKWQSFHSCPQACLLTKVSSSYISAKKIEVITIFIYTKCIEKTRKIVSIVLNHGTLSNRTLSLNTWLSLNIYFAFDHVRQDQQQNYKVFQTKVTKVHDTKGSVELTVSRSLTEWKRRRIYSNRRRDRSQCNFDVWIETTSCLSCLPPPWIVQLAHLLLQFNLACNILKWHLNKNVPISPVHFANSGKATSKS